jgi:hypothetical protein
MTARSSSTPMSVSQVPTVWSQSGSVLAGVPGAAGGRTVFRFDVAAVAA